MSSLLSENADSELGLELPTPRSLVALWEMFCVLYSLGFSYRFFYTFKLLRTLKIGKSEPEWGGLFLPNWSLGWGLVDWKQLMLNDGDFMLHMIVHVYLLKPEINYRNSPRCFLNFDANRTSKLTCFNEIRTGKLACFDAIRTGKLTCYLCSNDRHHRTHTELVSQPGYVIAFNPY